MASRSDVRHGRVNVAWRNWAGNVRLPSVGYYEPRSLRELQTAMREAGERFSSVRPVGHSFAWSGLMEGAEALISMKALDRPLADGVDLDGTQWVEVQAGMTMDELTRRTSRLGKDLVGPTIFPDLSIGGLIATGSHGSGLGHGAFSDEILQLTLVDIKGEVHVIQDGPELHAARVSLGALGVVYSVRVRVHDQFNVFVHDTPFPRDQLLDNLVEAVRSHEFVETGWFPLRPTMWVKAMDRTALPAKLGGFRRQVAHVLNHDFQMFIGQHLMAKLSRFVLHTWGKHGVSALMRLGEQLVMTEGTRVRRSRVAFHYQRAYPRVFDMSWSVPLERAPDAYRMLIEMVEQEARQDRYPINMFVLARYIGRSDSFLAMNQGRESCILEAAASANSVGHEDFYRRWQERMMDFPDARPHWGKLFTPERAIGDRYPELAAFEAVRARFDPERKLLNPALAEVLTSLESR